jgi:hypothetical protein
MTRFEKLRARWPSNEAPPVHQGKYEEKCQSYADMIESKGETFVRARQTAEAMYEMLAEGWFEETSPFVFTRTDKQHWSKQVEST